MNDVRIYMFSYENINPEQREGYYRERKRKYIEGYRKRVIRGRTYVGWYRPAGLKDGAVFKISSNEYP